MVTKKIHLPYTEEQSCKSKHKIASVNIWKFLNNHFIILS